MLLLVVAVLALALGAGLGRADWISHTYEPGEKVVLWLNKIGPFHNPQETYFYYSLPFCQPASSADLAVPERSIGEVLEGNELVDSGMKIQFRKDQPSRQICETAALTADEVDAFKYAVSQHYWYQSFVDDLPIWAMVGEMDASLEELLEMEAHHKRSEEHSVTHDVLVYTHRRLSIAYNGKAIIEVNLTSDLPVKVAPGVKLSFTCEVKWTETDTPFGERFNRYLDYSFFEHQIHWFSIFNSFMMVIFLCGLVALILVRTLNNDYMRFSREELVENGTSNALGDEFGWKQVNGDVFRTPTHLALLSAMVGTGVQLITLAFIVVVLAIAGSLYVDRGAMLSVVLQQYVLTFIVNGYASGRLFKRYESGKKWMGTLALTSLFFPVLVVLTMLGLKLISMYNSATSMVSGTTLVTVLLVFFLVALPLTVVGTLLGRHTSPEQEFPCRVNALPRPIPERSLLSHPGTIIAITGVLPFGAVFIEIFFIFSSMWSQKFYYVYGFLFLVLCILIVVTMCVTVVAVYFQLNSEDYRWPWTSFLAGGSTSVYVFAYGVYYFWFKTNMTGFLQTNYYFGYLGLFSAGLGLMCGAIGFVGAFVFVQTIFKNIKLD